MKIHIFQIVHYDPFLKLPYLVTKDTLCIPETRINDIVFKVMPHLPGIITNDGTCSTIYLDGCHWLVLGDVSDTFKEVTVPKRIENSLRVDLRV